MEDLRSQALVLIYPDGGLEKILVQKGKSEHLYYFHEWLKHSKKFANVIYHSSYKIDFRDWTILDKALAEAGLVVIRNMELIYVSNDLSFVDSEEAFGYLVNLPDNIKESRAYLPMKKIWKEHPKEDFGFGIYSRITKEFEDIEYNFFEEELETKEEEIKR